MCLNNNLFSNYNKQHNFLTMCCGTTMELLSVIKNDSYEYLDFYYIQDVSCENTNIALLNNTLRT